MTWGDPQDIINVQKLVDLCIDEWLNTMSANATVYVEYTKMCKVVVLWNPWHSYLMFSNLSYKPSEFYHV